MSDPFLRGVLTAFLGSAIGLLIYFYADNFRRDILTAVAHCAPRQPMQNGNGHLYPFR
jgi:hypothetical protein